MEILNLFVEGHARSKGSMVCQGGKHHHMIESVTQSKPWRNRVQAAIVRHVRALANGEISASQSHAGPVNVELVFTFDRPEGCDLPYPTIAGGSDALGDLDKLTRNILDALQGCGLISNDANVVLIAAMKLWTDQVPGAKQGVEIKVSTAPELNR